MQYEDDGRFDERLLAIIATAGAMVFALFLLVPVLRPYYAVLMPIGILLSAGAALWLLRSARRVDNARQLELSELESTITAGE